MKKNYTTTEMVYREDIEEEREYEFDFWLEIETARYGDNADGRLGETRTWIESWQVEITDLETGEKVETTPRLEKIAEDILEEVDYDDIY